MTTAQRDLTNSIKSYILRHVTGNPRNIVALTAQAWGISTHTVNKYARQLVDANKLEASGNTRARAYKLVTTEVVAVMEVTDDLDEDDIWRNRIQAHLTAAEDNVLAICQYGLTEMVNNVAAHSNATTLKICVRTTPISCEIIVHDNGLGIFATIQKAFKYDDPRQALLQLSKGKITSDPTGHTGEGVFFTSKMFDEFSIYSGNLFFMSERPDDEGWLIEVEEREQMEGTMITMQIEYDSACTMSEIFQKYATEDTNDFSRTHVSLSLARYGKELLISRSQARRVLASFELFREVVLDFRGIETIGQAFADEIFRVFQREHPEIRIIGINVTDAACNMIAHVTVPAPNPSLVA